MNKEQEAGVEVPYKNLSEDALRGLVESFILREGTDYGVNEVTLDKKVSQVLGQLDRGEVQILFDAESESFTLQPVKRKGGVIST
ncbi:MAG TPA: hypothetical protein DCL41_01210 [Bdellovibrionales bacterium]|nr:hypothetical protein [Pseudobdellovibrionaceae bacterium]HAG90457.1 hypothetical protein [Bdellovibrionales bacterium]|tara:strand:- start:36 stop:290 length:255 start_codon:yes stop_codon:yes gene_type:complete